MCRTICLSAAAVAALLAAPAQAAVTTQTYKFTLSDFTDVGGDSVAPPITSISGSFTLTFDPDLYVDSATAGLVVNFLSFGFVGSPLGYTNYPGAPDFLSIGGTQFGSDFISFGADDFALSLKFTDPAHPVFAICDDGYACGVAPGSTLASGYTLAAYPDSGWLPSTGTLTAIPEPAAWALMLLGFGLVGATMRGRAAQRFAA